MNINQSKAIKIVDYLSWKGYQPIRRTPAEWWYLSPLRTETSPSFSVNLEKNVWSDKGLPGERPGQKYCGGAIHTLAAKLCGSIPAGLADLANMCNHKTPSTNPLTAKPDNAKLKEYPIKIHNYKPIEYKPLVEYIDSRKISRMVARVFCHEVWYEHKGNPQRYFAIGLRNNSKGWELRGIKYKGCAINKDVTLIKSQPHAKKLLVFEGMFDMLTYMTILGTKEKIDTVHWLCLNSVSMSDYGIAYMSDYDEVRLYLDNDEAGTIGTKAICGLLKGKCKVLDCRTTYSRYKDMNEWWTAEGAEQKHKQEIDKAKSQK